MVYQTLYLFMDSSEDIRWQQRFDNYRKALKQLAKFVDIGNLSDMEEQGLIKSFEYTYELAWNTMKDYLQYIGIVDVAGSRGAIKEAFKINLIEDGQNWIDMIESRNLTAHSYNEETAQEIKNVVVDVYFDLFQQLDIKLESLRSGQQGGIL